MQKRRVQDNIMRWATDRNRSMLLFALFFAWLLSVPFQGQVVYALAQYPQPTIETMLSASALLHLAGLALSWFLVKSLPSAKTLTLICIPVCFAATGLLLASPGVWAAALLVSSFLAGACLASWAYFLKSVTHRSERVKTVADGLVITNVLVVCFHMAAIHISAQIGLLLAMASLAGAFLLVLRLPCRETAQAAVRIPGAKSVRFWKPLLFLGIFICIITINSGLVSGVQAPAFSHLEDLTSWYWALPYIAGLIAMRNMPGRINRTYILYAAMGMIGLSYLFFAVLESSAISYLIVNTLIFAACGVFDLFWWGILSEMFDYGRNPARTLGVGLCANVLGVLLGRLIGGAIMAHGVSSTNPALLALGVVCITLTMLPPLYGYLTLLLKDHAYLTMLAGMTPQAKAALFEEVAAASRLSGREGEVTNLLLQGYAHRAIAQQLRVSRSTLRTHIQNIYSKYNVQSRAELLNLLLRRPPYPR